MNLIDILTSINGYTISLLAILLLLVFTERIKIKNKNIGSFIIGGIIVVFFIIGWNTLDYDKHIYKEGKQISFQNHKFLEICNLKKLYKANGYEYRVISGEFSIQYDCLISSVEDLSLKHEEDKVFLEMGEVKLIEDKKVFTIVNSLLTKSIGLISSFGGDGIAFIILKSNNRSYVISKSDLEYGEIQ
jgi:hypothetical protein